MTSGRLLLPAALDHLDAGVAAFAAALHEDLRRPVPGCPGWDLAALAGHLGGVHRWARSAVVQARPGVLSEAGPDDSRDIAAWFAEGAAALAATLRATEPATGCWTFGPPPRTVAFWQRRMPHETTLHAWDAHAALGEDLPLDRDLALDGVDEVVTMFVPRQVRLGRLVPPPRALELRATDAPQGVGPWKLFAGEGEGETGGGGDVRAPDAVVAAPAATLLLLLWRRIPLDTDGVAVAGDAAAAHALFDAPLTP
jgi:uncharacterized protein (TIGR03083 family)